MYSVFVIIILHAAPVYMYKVECQVHYSLTRNWLIVEPSQPACDDVMESGIFVTICTGCMS